MYIQKKQTVYCYEVINLKNIIENGKDFFCICSQIQITSDSKVLIDGCKKILEYNDVFVKVKTWEMTVNIWGSGLTVNDFGNSAIYVCGKIQSVELEK